MAGNKSDRQARAAFPLNRTVLKIILLVALVVATIALLTLRFALLDAKDKTEELRQQAVALEQENQKLERTNALLGTVQGVKELANELLGLVDPNTIIFEPVE